MLVYVLRHLSVPQGDVSERDTAGRATQVVVHHWRLSVAAHLNAAAAE
jgi:hypothetical protein